MEKNKEYKTQLKNEKQHIKSITGEHITSVWRCENKIWKKVWVNEQEHFEEKPLQVLNNKRNIKYDSKTKKRTKKDEKPKESVKKSIDPSFHILGAKILKGEIIWAVDYNGVKEIIPNSTMRKVHPHELVKFYESSLVIESS